MKKFKLFPLAIAALALGSCSTDDTADNNPSVDGVKSYIAVNINNVGAGGTRDLSNDDFENGTDKENQINLVRFYFFNQDGSAYNMADGKNYIEQSVTGNGTQAPNVERITDAVLVIDGATRTAPHSMAAVINPATSDLGAENLTRSQLEGKVCKGFFTGTGADATGFVMSNSVYVADGAKTWFSNISGKVSTVSADDAKSNPVDIYVERVAAKVTSTASGAIDGKFEVGTTENGKKVYAQIKGWGIANTNAKANLVKNIDTSWTNETLGFTPWNADNYYRCFWETSDDTELTTSVSYNSLTTQINGVVYTQPNTSATSSPEYIAAAQLVYEDGTQAEICQYKGVQYLSENDVKKVILGENKQYFKKTASTADGDTYVNLSESDIKFVTNPTHSYQVNANLVDDNLKLYKKSGDTWNDVTDEAKAALAKEPAQIRKAGMAYYFTKINHLGEVGKTAQFGLVRNHVYKIDVNTITGFGTPVYNPDEAFDPVVPEQENTYLAARINVLSWRVVKQTVDLK